LQDSLSGDIIEARIIQSTKEAMAIKLKNKIVAIFFTVFMDLFYLKHASLVVKVAIVMDIVIVIKLLALPLVYKCW